MMNSTEEKIIKQFSKKNAEFASSDQSIDINSDGESNWFAVCGYNARIFLSGDYARIASSGDYTRVNSAHNFASSIASGGNHARVNSSGKLTTIALSGDHTRVKSSGILAKIASSGNHTKIKTTGEDAVVVSSGFETRVSGKEGTWISLAEYDDDGKCIGFATGQIGKDGLEPGVEYYAKGGKLVVVNR